MHLQNPLMGEDRVLDLPLDAGRFFILGIEGVNISDMTNKSRDEYAYTLLDLETAASKEALDALKAITGVSRVRVVK